MKEKADHKNPYQLCLACSTFIVEMADEDDYYYYDCAVARRDQHPNPHASGCRDDQVMELLWQNSQVVIQDKQSHKKSEDHHPVDLVPAVVAGDYPPLQINHHDSSLQPQHQQNNDIANNNLFIQEDETATWSLSDFCSDLLLLPSSSPTAPAPAPSTVASHPAPHPTAVPPPRRFENFGHFSRLNRPRATTAVEATVVDSSDTPMIARVSYDAAGHNVARVSAISTSTGVKDAANCDLTVTSSSGASSASTDPIPPMKSLKAAPPLPSTRKTTTDIPEEGKRIASGGEGGERHKNGKDVELIHKEGKKRVRGGSSSSKRSLAAEVHNLSERRRRDRINEKMRALQELVPHCNKTDKASMLDEAIEYLKSLQMQVQVMSMGCGMMPMMYPYPGLQQYMPHMGMGLGIGMGMEMGMNRPMVQFPHVFTSSGDAGPPMCPRFSFPAFRMPPPNPAPNNQPDTVLSSVSSHNSNHPRMPGFMDPYQQFLGLQHMHSPLHQANTSSNGLATTSKAGENSRKVSPD